MFGMEIGQMGQVGGFSWTRLIASMYQNGGQGAWLDANDLSTLFQDSAGTTPVTAVEQPVGLMLDKSQGAVLGPELVTGGGFDNPANWTTSTWTISAGMATYPDTINDFIRPANVNLLPLVAGKTYCVRFTLSGVTGSATCAVANADGSVAYTAITSFTTNGEKQFIIYAAASTTNIRFYGYTSSGGTWSLDNISVKELPGNHASQATTTKRTIYSRRVNLVTESEFRNGVTDAPTRGGLVTATTMTGYLGALAFGHSGVTVAYAYKAVDIPTVSHTLSVVIETTDGLAPSFGSAVATSVLNTFVLVISGGAVSPLTYVVSPLGAGRFRVTCTGVGAAGSPGHGVVKYTTNDTRTFSCTAYDLRLSIDANLPYQRVNTATDYDADPAKFPAYTQVDGTDDALTSATGGGGTTGFFFASAVLTTLTGAKQVLLSDAGTNTGYEVSINAANKLQLSVGTGATRVTVESAALSANTRYVLTAWHDGTNIYVRVNNGAPVSAVCGAASAGTAGITQFCENGASAGYFRGRSYGVVYRKDAAPGPATINAVVRYLAAKSGGPV